MKRALQKTTCACLASAALLLGGAASATAAPAPGALLSRQVDDDGNARDQRTDDDRGDNGLWGLLGLLGLLGLAGLARRGPKPGAMAGYPVAGTDAPPANTYPAAEPQRRPPGA